MVRPAASAPCSAWNGGRSRRAGPDAKGVKVGDKIMGSGGAAFAEYTLADHGRLFRAPSNMNFEEAATLPVALATMHNAVVTNGALQKGQSVLIQGASSGVGLMAMQIAKFKGAKLVIGSSTDAMRRSRLKEFGADLAVDSSDPGWVDQVLKATGGEGVDLIVDQVSGKVANQNLAATKVKGRIVNVGRLGGTHADFNFDLHAARRINYIGVTFRTRTIEEVRDIFDEVRKDIWGAVEIAKAAIADRQGLSVRRDRKCVRAHGSQQAPRQDRGDAVADDAAPPGSRGTVGSDAEMDSACTRS